jgi:hypothetical protein
LCSRYVCRGLYRSVVKPAAAVVLLQRHSALEFCWLSFRLSPSSFGSRRWLLTSFLPVAFPRPRSWSFGPSQFGLVLRWHRGRWWWVPVTVAFVGRGSRVHWANLGCEKIPVASVPKSQVVEILELQWLKNGDGETSIYGHLPLQHEI